jgi:hypothetical protein
MAERSSADDQPCDEKHPWPDILVKGSIDPHRALYSILDRSVSLQMDAAMEASMAKRLTSAGGSIAWLRPRYDPDKDPKSKVFKGEPESENVTPPSCIDCPRADYPGGVEAVAKSKRGPAKASDGTPIEVWRKVDITLPLY